MSNLQAAVSLAELMNPIVGVPLKTRTKLEVAKRVFTLAAAGGFPYTGQTYKDWAKKWLTSDTYQLMEIDINAAASPHLPKNPERVAFRLLCASDSMDPIVVDLNKQKTGKSHLGYIPRIVVLDGKHRKQAQMLQGHSRILAWVGCRAEKHLSNTRVIDYLDFSKVKPPVLGKGITIQASQLTMPRSGHSLTTDFNLHCATTPATGQVMLDQSGGEKGSRPKDAFVKAGGPGSGPRPGYERTLKDLKNRYGSKGSGFSYEPVHMGMHKALVNSGYKYEPVGYASGGGSHSRYTKGSAIFTTKDDGRWSHEDYTAKTGKNYIASGRAGNLQNHLKSIGNLQGGAGSGMGSSLGSGSGSNPLTMRGKKAKDCKACGAPNSMGQLDDASEDDSNDSDYQGKVPSASDQASFVSPSDIPKWNFPKPNINAPGNDGWETEPGTLVGSNLAPFLTRSPGATRSEMSKKFRSFKQGTGTGPTLGKNTGATRSEMSRLQDTVPGVGTHSVQGKGKVVRQIYTKAPPGKEAQVLALKKKYGEDSPIPFKIAWNDYNKEMEAKGR
jgi:hypothetical protein